MKKLQTNPIIKVEQHIIISIGTYTASNEKAYIVEPHINVLRIKNKIQENNKETVIFLIFIIPFLWHFLSDRAIDFVSILSA